MDTNLQAGGSKPSTSTKGMSEQTPTTCSMLNDASKPPMVQRDHLPTTYRAGLTPKKAEQLLLMQSVPRSELRGKRKLLASNPIRTKKAKSMQDLERPDCKVVVEKICRVISASTSTCVGNASQGLHALETHVAAGPGCKDSQGDSVVYPASSSRSKAIKPAVKTSSDQSQYLNDGPSKIPSASSAASVADFLEHDILEKGLEVLDFLENDVLDILKDNVMNIVNKLCGSYLEHELIEYLGPITYQHIAKYKSASFEDCLQQYQQRLNFQRNHQTIGDSIQNDLVTDEIISTSVGIKTFSSFDIDPSELLTEADKSIADRLKTLQKQEVAEENASRKNVENTGHVLAEVLNDTECNDEVKSASAPTCNFSSKELEALIKTGKNTEFVVLKGLILSPVKVNPSQLSQPSTAGVSSTTKDGNPRMIEVKNAISGGMEISQWNISNDVKQKFNRVFHRITMPPTAKIPVPKITQNMYVANESSSQKNQMGSNSACKSVTELTQPEASLIHIDPKLIKPEEVSPKKTEANPLPTPSLETHQETPASSSQNKPEISVKMPNQHSESKYSVVLKGNAVAGKLCKTSITYVTSPNKKNDVEDSSSQEPATSTKPTALRCYSGSKLSATAHETSNNRAPESQLSAGENKLTTGALVKSGESVKTITSEDSVKTEIAVKTTSYPELQQNLDECDNEGNLSLATTVDSDRDIDKSIDENCPLLANQVPIDIGDAVDCPSSSLETGSIESLKKSVPDVSLAPLQSMTTNNASDSKTSTSGSKEEKNTETNKVEPKEASIKNLIKAIGNSNEIRFVNVSDSSRRKQCDQTGLGPKSEIINVTKLRTYGKSSRKSEKEPINTVELKTTKDSTHISKLKICTGNQISLQDFRSELADTNLGNKKNIDSTNYSTVKNLPAEISTKLRMLSQRDVRISKATSLMKPSTCLPCHIETENTVLVQTVANSAKENQGCEEIDKKPTSKDNLHISELKTDPMQVIEKLGLQLKGFLETTTVLKTNNTSNGITLKNLYGHDSKIIKIFPKKIIEIPPASLRCSNEKINSKNENISNTGHKTGEEISKKVEEKCISKIETSEDNLNASELKVESCDRVMLHDSRKEITDSGLKQTESVSNVNKENIDPNKDIAVKNSCGQDSEKIKISSHKIIENQTEVNSKNGNISDIGDKPGEKIIKKFEKLCGKKKETSQENLHISEVKAETCDKELTDSDINTAESVSNVYKENIDTSNAIANTVFEPDDLSKADSRQSQQSLNMNKTSKEKKLPLKKPIKLRSSKDARKKGRNQGSLLRQYALAKISKVSKTIQNRVRKFERLAYRKFDDESLKRTLAKFSQICWFLKPGGISPRKTQRINRNANSIRQPKNLNGTHVDDALKNDRVQVAEELHPRALDLDDLKKAKSDSQLLLGGSQDNPTAVADRAVRRSYSAPKDTNEIIQCFFYEKPERSYEEIHLDMKKTKRMETEQEESLNSLKNGPPSTRSAGTNNRKLQRRRQLQEREQTRYFLRKRGNNLSRNTLQ